MFAVGCVVVAIAAPAVADPAAPRPTARGSNTDHGVVERSRVEVAAPTAAGFTQLVIDNPLGDVRVEGYDGHTMMIETRKHAPDEDTLDRLRVSLVPNPDGTVRIATTADGGREVRPVSRAQVQIDLVIRAPRNARVDATASSGRLEVVDMDAGAELDTSSGPISVRNVQGNMSTHSVSGAMSIVQVFGSVDAETITSDVDLDTIGGDRLVASANRGRIAGRRVRARDIELTTTDGKIVLEAETALRGHLVVSSLHGDVDVRLHRHGAITVRARGTKVDLGTPVTARADGWVQTAFGELSGQDPPAMVELRSRWGVVQLAVVE
jgi:hypothetical protein